MFEDFTNNLNVKRETNKIGLETFAMDRYNILDRPIDILIENLKADIEKEYDEHQIWIYMQENNPERFNELEEKAEQTGHSLFFQMEDYIKTAMYIEEELTSLFEMKIIYAFKHLEIEIKTLINATYGKSSVSKLSKWDNLIQFLKSKKIDIKKIVSYKEVNQLRSVNNSLKHSNELIDSHLNGIEEFKGNEQIDYLILEKFYNRIKFSSNEFLSSLSNEIYDNLYNFNDEKLDRISKSIVLRMDKKNAEKLIDRIKKQYE